MARVYGNTAGALANILEVESGQVRVDELRDGDGIGLVYDVAHLASPQTYALTTRGWDSGAINENVGVTIGITGLPRLARILAFHAQTDDAARVSQVWLYYENIGTRDTPLWLWRTGGDTVPLPAAIDIGDADLGTLLVPAAVDEWVSRQPIYRDVTGASRTGATQLSVRVISTAFGAGTVRATGHVTMAFPLSPVTTALEIPILR